MAEVVDLRDDGTIRLAWDDHDVTLRRPKLREYRSFTMEQSAAAEALTSKATDSPAGKMIAETDMLGTDEAPGPYLALYQRMIQELSGQAVDVWDLPLWATSVRLYNDIVNHWREVPLGPGRP